MLYSSNRRRFLQHAAAGAVSTSVAAGLGTWTDNAFSQHASSQSGWALGTMQTSSPNGSTQRPRDLKVSTFKVKVTPPMGHGCCGGWIKPVEAITDDLEAIGIVLSGDFQPIVLCAVDWTGILNRTHLLWRETIAKAVKTTPERVAVQCVHQHNAPFACLDAQAMVAKHNDLPAICDSDYVVDCANRVAQAAADSMAKRQPLTHLEIGKAKVERVASNRRMVNDAGELVDWRGSSSRNPAHKEWPEGLIDPWLRTIAFCNGGRRVAALHYYATHPMSFYGDGLVTSDFVGIARKAKQAESPDCMHVYFTGCSGNIAAGKYNDGSPEARKQLTERMKQAMDDAEKSLETVDIDRLDWRHQEALPIPKPELKEAALLKQIADVSQRVVDRNRPAFQAAWLQRFQNKQPIILSALHLGPTTILHLPAESFIEYQLAAQAMQPEQFVCMAAYGDYGPGYIGTSISYGQGGYETSRVSRTAPEVEGVLTEGIAELLGVDGSRKDAPATQVPSLIK